MAPLDLLAVVARRQPEHEADRAEERAPDDEVDLALPRARHKLHCEGSGKLDTARSRLYRSQILQVNMRLKALAEIYTMRSFAQL